MNTTANKPAQTCRRRRKHSDEFKAQAVAACRHAGVSIAAIALANGINANLLRRWILAAVASSTDRCVAVVSNVTAGPSFIPVPLAGRTASQDIRIELHRSATAISITWPTSAAADCAAWMRELLR